MQIPAIAGTIRRRILVNFRADPGVVQRQLPLPFRPKLHDGQAIVGVCLIRLENIRPRLLPAFAGISSENAAHRIAVLWDDEAGETREGVFISRRDTDSALNVLAGGRIFPGQHHRAEFRVVSEDDAIDFQMRSRDGEVEVRVRGRIAPSLPAASCFASLAEASAFFESGCLGYSVRCDSPRLDGLILKTKSWRVEALDVGGVHSSFYADEKRFPRGSVVFDHALIMRDIEHEWHSAPPMTAQARSSNRGAPSIYPCERKPISLRIVN
jgi:uncharacterized protein DUF2071